MDQPPSIPDYRRPRRRRRGVRLLPSLFTLGNLLCGFASISFAARGIDVSAPPPDHPRFGSTYAIAGYFIFLAMVFDMFDGFVARLTRSASDFGAELDSLADMVSFGLAPAFISIHLIGFLFHTQDAAGHSYYNFPGPFQDDDWLRLFWVVAAVYVCCTALRLARFNVTKAHDALSHMNFRGMPSPGAAAVVAATVIFFESLRVGVHIIPFNVPPAVALQLKAVFPYLLPAMLLLAALLMVSRFTYAHLVNRFLRGRKTFRKLVAVLLLIMVIVFEPQLTTIVAIYIYAISAPVIWLFHICTGKKPAAASPPSPPASPEGKSS